MSEKILLSICIPTRNRAARLNKLVSDCLKIKSDRIEVVVMDDCSNDNTKVLMKSINDKRFRYYRNSESIGYPNMAYCLAAGNGKFCMLMRDKDTIPNIAEWFNQAEPVFERSDLATVFRGTLVDTEGQLRDRARKWGGGKRDTFENYLSVLKGSYYSAAIIYPQKIVKENLDLASKSAPYLWTLYPQICLFYFCAKYGEIVPLENFVVLMPAQIDSYVGKYEACCGAGQVPYSAVESRQKQCFDVVRLFKTLNTKRENTVPFMAYLLEHQCQWIEGAFHIPYVWSYLPKNFPKFHYWHLVYWESYYSLIKEIEKIHNVSLLNATFEMVFQRYKNFANHIAAKEINEAQALFFSKQEVDKSIF